MLSNLLTSSRLICARRCRREHRIKYELGFRAAGDAKTLHFGTLIHRGLEAWWKAVKAGQSQDEWLIAAQAAMSGESDPFDLARAQVLMTGYHLRWKDEPYEVLAVEVRFETELVNPESGCSSRTWVLGGKIDVVVRDRRDGLIRIVEHKTSSEPIGVGSDYWKRLRMDGQVSLYFQGSKSLGFEAVECIYDVIGKPQQRPLEANSRRAFPETPDEFRARVGAVVAEEHDRFFQRGVVVRLENEMRDALIDAWQIGKQLREEERAGIFPRNVDQCVRFGRLCEFFPVCSGEASLDDVNRYRQSSTVHPELEEAAP